jgi:putative ATP-dependent endonuclease of the OLD family
MRVSVLHDIDSPCTSGGKRKNSAYTVNKTITEAVAESRQKKIRVVHRCSCPNFEQNHRMELPDKDKPFESWNAVRNNSSNMSV